MQAKGIRPDTLSSKEVPSLRVKASTSIDLSTPCMPRKLESFIINLALAKSMDTHCSMLAYKIHTQGF
jgi:hypothetical protein